jgi:hypothetical protein
MGAKGSKPPTPAPAPVTTAPVTTPAPRVVRISANQVIDPSDASIFPEKVRNELMAVRAEVPPNELFLVKEFDRSSELIKWLQGSKSFFNYNVPSNNENNEEENEEEANTEAEERERKTTAMINAMLALNKSNKTRKNTSGNETEVAKEVRRLLSAVEATPVGERNNLATRLARLRVAKGGNGVERNKDPFMWKLYSMCEGAGIRDQFLANLLEVSDHILLAFLNSGHIAGFSIFGPDHSGGSEGCLHRYITCVGPRKLGIGAGIVKEFHAIAKQEGYPCVTLGASSAEGFHLKQGYTYTGKRSLEGPEMIYEIRGGRRKRGRIRKSRKQRR